MTSHQHAAAAMQYLSSPRQRRIFTHTGWRQIDGAWNFLHGAGAIAASGFVRDVEVELERGLKQRCNTVMDGCIAQEFPP